MQRSESYFGRCPISILFFNLLKAGSIKFIYIVYFNFSAYGAVPTLRLPRLSSLLVGGTGNSLPVLRSNKRNSKFGSGHCPPMRFPEIPHRLRSKSLLQTVAGIEEDIPRGIGGHCRSYDPQNQRRWNVALQTEHSGVPECVGNSAGHVRQGTGTGLAQFILNPSRSLPLCDLYATHT
jgi:hypothetical protein